MTTRDKPVMRLVIDTIEKNGPMTVRALMSELCMTQNAVSKRCYDARNAGYLTMTFEREREMVGRKGAIYTRTAKPFDETIVAPKTLKDRERKRRNRENEIARKLRAEAAKARKMIGQPFVPFRHPFDVILATFFAGLALYCALMVEVSALMAPLWWEVMWTALCLLFIYGIREIFREKW